MRGTSTFKGWVNIGKNYIDISIIVHKEGRLYSALCNELDIYSSGDVMDEALSNIQDAIYTYFNRLDNLGQVKQVLESKGIKLRSKPSYVSMQPFRRNIFPHFWYKRGDFRLELWRDTEH